MGGVRVLFRLTNRISIIRPWSCFTALLVLIGLPGFWLFALGFWLTAGPGFAHALAKFIFTIVCLAIGLFILVVAVATRSFIRLTRQINRERREDAAARAIADAALRRRWGLKP